MPFERAGTRAPPDGVRPVARTTLLGEARLMSTDSGKWYFCLRHHEVEPQSGCSPANRLGPYPTETEARNALAKVAERNDEWDNDPRWNDDVDTGR